MTFDELLEKLTAQAIAVDAAETWPVQQFSWLSETDVLKWTIPPAYGGLAISEIELAEGYGKLAQACLTTCFILTQRIGACQRIVGSKNEEIKAELLPRLATGELFATVGISHLTTSRQHLERPAVVVTEQENDFVLNGIIPWVTGSAAADYIVTGGTCEDRRQVLLALPAELDGISVQPKTRLMALSASETASVRLTEVHVSKRYLLAGPIENVMKRGKGGGTGSLMTSTLALGLAIRSLAILQDEAKVRDELRSQVATFSASVESLRSGIRASIQGGGAGDEGLSASAIRQKSNSLVLRMTQAALAVTKGTGFAKGHPAELAVREAMFFLVWSCPQPVVEGVLNELACRDTW